MELNELYFTEAFSADTKEKIIGSIKFLDLRYVDEFELLFLVTTAGTTRFKKKFNPANQKQIEEILLQDFKYDGIIKLDGSFVLNKGVESILKYIQYEKRNSNIKSSQNSKERESPEHKRIHSNSEIRENNIQSPERILPTNIQRNEQDRDIGRILLHEREDNAPTSRTSHESGSLSYRSRRNVVAGTHDVEPGGINEFYRPDNNARNYIIKNEFPPINNLTRLNYNLEAIKIIAKVNKEQEITPDEKEILARYSGFGGLSDILRTPQSLSFRSLSLKFQEVIEGIYDEVKKIDPEKKLHVIESLKNSSLTAYYTPLDVINGMYDILDKANFSGGNILEPSAGTGYFLGTMPDKFKKTSTIHGVEKDILSGYIAKLLYPDVSFKIKGLEEANLPKNHFDLIIGNIPFGDIRVHDSQWQNSALPIYKFAQQRIHNYFIVKNIELAAEGGVIALLTSSATLDTPGNNLIRKYISENTEFLGAIRLPNNAFKNTNTTVVSDILFLRKFYYGEKKQQKYNILDLATTLAKHKNYNSVFEVSYNKYFEENPEMLLGEIAAGGNYSETVFALLPKDSDKNIRELIADKARSIIPENFSFGKKTRKKKKPVIENVIERYVEFDHALVKEGNIVMQNGKIGKIILSETDSSEILPTNEKSFIPITFPEKYKKRIPFIIRLRNSLSDLMLSELYDHPSEELDEKRQILNKRYKEYVEFREFKHERKQSNFKRRYRRVYSFIS